jgi:hypothetical protein
VYESLLVADIAATVEKLGTTKIDERAGFSEVTASTAETYRNDPIEHVTERTAEGG